MGEIKSAVTYQGKWEKHYESQTVYCMFVNKKATVASAPSSFLIYEEQTIYTLNYTHNSCNINNIDNIFQGQLHTSNQGNG